jgi:hypothetical protein
LALRDNDSFGLTRGEVGLWIIGSAGLLVAAVARFSGYRDTVIILLAGAMPITALSIAAVYVLRQLMGRGAADAMAILGATGVRLACSLAAFGLTWWLLPVCRSITYVTTFGVAYALTLLAETAAAFELNRRLNPLKPITRLQDEKSSRGDSTS